MCTKVTKFEIGKKYINDNSVIRECIHVQDQRYAVLIPIEKGAPIVIDTSWPYSYKEYKPPVVHTAHVYFWRHPLFGDKIHRSAADTEITRNFMKDTQILNHQVVTWTEELEQQYQSNKKD